MLDCLVDLAYEVSHDFFKRPHEYTDLRLPTGASGGVTITPTLAKLHAEYGTDPQVLNCSQRKVIYSALFGTSAGHGMGEGGNFPRLRDELLVACATFVETKFGDEASLRINVRQKHVLFKEYLTGLQGDSVRWSREVLSVLTEQISYAILRNRGVAAVFTGATAPRDAWPYVFDSNADKLVEASSKFFEANSNKLTWAGKSGETNKGERPHMEQTREDITNRQRVALEGAKAIATAIDVDASSTDADIDLLIRKCYTWYTALNSLKDYPRPYPSTIDTRPAEKVPAGYVGLAQPSLAANNEAP